MKSSTEPIRKLTLRIPESLVRRAKVSAAANGTTLEAVVAAAIQAHVPPLPRGF